MISPTGLLVIAMILAVMQQVFPLPKRGAHGKACWEKVSYVSDFLYVQYISTVGISRYEDLSSAEERCTRPFTASVQWEGGYWVTRWGSN